jgi:hypothetical protein
MGPNKAVFTLGQRIFSQSLNSGTDRSSTPGAPLFSSTPALRAQAPSSQEQARVQPVSVVLSAAQVSSIAHRHSVSADDQYNHVLQVPRRQ